MRVIKIYLGKKKLITHKTNKMGYGNKSVSGVHPILKHMNKLGGNPEIKYDPIAHDEKGMGRGGKLGTAEYGEGKGMPGYKSDAQRMAVHASKAEKGSPAYGKMKSEGVPKHGKMHSDGMPKHGYHDKGMPMHHGKKGKGMPHIDNMVSKGAATDHHKGMSTAQKINHQKKK